LVDSLQDEESKHLIINQMEYIRLSF